MNRLLEELRPLIAAARESNDLVEVLSPATIFSPRPGAIAAR
jgi:hypothetical protein